MVVSAKKNAEHDDISLRAKTAYHSLRIAAPTFHDSKLWAARQLWLHVITQLSTSLNIDQAQLPRDACLHGQRHGFTYQMPNKLTTGHQKTYKDTTLTTWISTNQINHGKWTSVLQRQQCTATSRWWWFGGCASVTRGPASRGCRQSREFRSYQRHARSDVLQPNAYNVGPLLVSK